MTPKEWGEKGGLRSPRISRCPGNPRPAPFLSREQRATSRVTPPPPISLRGSLFSSPHCTPFAPHFTRGQFKSQVSGVSAPFLPAVTCPFFGGKSFPGVISELGRGLMGRGWESPETGIRLGWGGHSLLATGHGKAWEGEGVASIPQGEGSTPGFQSQLLPPPPPCPTHCLLVTFPDTMASPSPSDLTPAPLLSPGKATSPRAPCWP